MKRQWANNPKTKTERPEFLHRPISEEWDEYDTLFYNAWLSVEMRPTRLYDNYTVMDIGIRGNVDKILRRIRLRTMYYEHYVMYPDAARQFLATCRVYYANELDKGHTGGAPNLYVQRGEVPDQHS